MTSPALQRALTVRCWRFSEPADARARR